ncbi:hypothetical protein Tco_1029748 [Tanacetum coccineum]|uniref:Uncharacterized protein n=1 Tax=Tanacetum coccineum TaxID=301880 RepID=A0ABQ5G6K1_9ASTR
MDGAARWFHTNTKSVVVAVYGDGKFAGGGWPKIVGDRWSPARTTCNSSGGGRRGARNDDNKGGNPNIVVIITQQLQDFLPTIIMEIGNHINNRGNRDGGRNDDNNNGRNANGGNEHDNPGNDCNNHGGNKYESVIDINNCVTHQRARRSTAQTMRCRNWRMNCGTTPWWGLVMQPTQTSSMNWPSWFPAYKRIDSAILKAGPLTSDTVRDGKLSKSGDKRKGGSESSKQAGTRVENKRANVTPHKFKERMSGFMCYNNDGDGIRMLLIVDVLLD